MSSGGDDLVQQQALDGDALRRIGALAEIGRGEAGSLGRFSRDLMLAVRADMIRIWGRTEEGFKLASGVSRGEASEGDRAMPKWGERFERVLGGGPIALARRGRSEGTDGPDLFLFPFGGEGDPPAVAEVLFGDPVPREIAAVRFEAAEWACGQWGRAAAAAPSDGPRDDRSRTAAGRGDAADGPLLRFVAGLQRAAMTNEACRVIANDGAPLVGCDRLSVILRNGRRFRVEASTGREEVHKRSEIVKALRKLARPICRSQEPLVFDGSDVRATPEIEKPLAKLVEHGGSVGVVAVPLYAPAKRPVGDEDRDEADEKKGRGKPVGCLVAEWLVESGGGETEAVADLSDALDRVGRVVAWSEAPLAAARERGRVPLWRTQRLVGTVATELWGRRKLLTALILTACAATTAALCLIDVPYRFTATGSLMPETRRRVFANVEGEVAKVLVDGGDTVAAGTRLVDLENEPLQMEIVSVDSELAEKRQQLAALTARRATVHGDEAVEVAGEIEMARVDIEGLLGRQKLLAVRAKDLAVEAPIDGVIATFRARERLLGRPVQRGDVLVEVMDPDRPWRLELTIPESRVGHLKRAMADAENAVGPKIDVEYLILTEPEVTYPATLHTLSNRTDPSAEGAGEVDALATLDPEDLPRLRIGAEVRARVTCGDCSLAYAVFGDVVEFVRRYLWF